MEDDAQGVAAAGAQLADAVVHADAIAAAGSAHRPVVDGEDQAVALAQPLATLTQREPLLFIRLAMSPGVIEDRAAGFVGELLDHEVAAGRLFVLGTASVCVLGYDHGRDEPAIHLWNDMLHVGK